MDTRILKDFLLKEKTHVDWMKNDGFVTAFIVYLFFTVVIAVITAIYVSHPEMLKFWDGMVFMASMIAYPFTIWEMIKKIRHEYVLVRKDD